MGPGEDDNAVWEQLITRQHDIFLRTVNRNQELEARVKELERELHVWKTAFANTEQENETSKKQVVDLERSITSMKDDNAMVLCLIDGDGCIFSSELLNQGQAGGRQAAQVLTKGITDYMTANGHGRAQIVATVYMNKLGLQETLNNHGRCNPTQFESFLNGFNQASPLFHIVDVGSGKEAADAKLRDHMRFFSRFPQTAKIFFGGSHDNGYVSALASLQNEGLLQKVIVLQGYNRIASEYKGFALPTVEFKGLFISEKIPPNNRHGTTPGTPIPSLAEFFPDSQSPRINPLAPPTPSTSQGSMKIKLQGSEPRKNFKLRTIPCNYHYLTSNCRHGANCSYNHDLKLTPDQLASMRIKIPCVNANKGKPCKEGDRCPYGHVCPRGLKCQFYQGGNCKFVWKDMHQQPNIHTFGHKREQSVTDSNPSEVSTPLSISSASFVPSSSWDHSGTSTFQDELYRRL